MCITYLSWDIPWDIPDFVGALQNTAKLFRLNRSQAVRLPKEVEFSVQEVYLRRDGEDVIVPRGLGTGLGFCLRRLGWSAPLALGADGRA